MPAHSAVATGPDASIAEDLDLVWTEVQPPVVRRLMVAATGEFWARGYHATTTRDIARRAGLSPAGVYVHFRSKEEVLYRITLIGHQQSLADVLDSIAGLDDPFARLHSMVSRFSAWHARYHLPARVIHNEMRALAPEHLAEVIEVRRGIDAAVRSTLDYGVAQGAFDVPDVGGAALVIMSLGIDVARWYRADGERTPTAIGELHADMAARMFRRQAASGPAGQ